MSARYGIDFRIESKPLRALGYHVTSRVRCAARYAKLTRCSIREAAETFEINPGAVWNAWDRIYPHLAQPISADRKPPTPMIGPRRERHRGPPVCSACNEIGHVAIHGRCSPSELAVRMVRGGASVQEAADAVGVANQTVYAALQNRRRAA